MQTGQNSIAPETSLPQLGQMRWGSVLMGLTALRSQSEPKTTPRSTEWCESGRQGPWQTVVPFHKLCVPLYVLPVVIETKNTRATGTSEHTQTNQDPENFGPQKGTPGKKCRINFADFLKLGLSHAFVS
jgi:hypothetical protein